MRLDLKKRVGVGVLVAACVLGGLPGEPGVWASPASGGGAAEKVRPAGDVVVVLNEDFFNALLEAIMEQPGGAKFPLSKGGSPKCPGEVALLRESGGRRTAARFDAGRVGATVAFRGSYEAPLVGCLNFEGAADTLFHLSFDAERQAFVARVEVRNIDLKNVPSLMGGGITGLVQDAIDARINPVEILRADQLAARLPLAQGNALRLRAKEVRHEVVGRELRLRIVYEIVSE